MPAEQDGLKQHRKKAEPRGQPSHGAASLGHAELSAATMRRRHAWVADTNVVTPTPTTLKITNRNGRPSESRLWTWSGVAMPKSAMSGKTSATNPKRKNAMPPQVSVRAAVVSAMLRLALPGRPRRAAQRPNAAPAAAWTMSVPRPKKNPGSQPVAAEGMAGASVV